MSKTAYTNWCKVLWIWISGNILNFKLHCKREPIFACNNSLIMHLVHGDVIRVRLQGNMLTTQLECRYVVTYKVETTVILSSDIIQLYIVTSKLNRFIVIRHASLESCRDWNRYTSLFCMILFVCVCSG